MAAIFKRLRRLFERRWPDGEPVTLADGTRYSTRMPDGSVLLAPEFTFTPFAIDPRDVSHLESRRFSPNEIVSGNGGAR